MVHVIDNRWFGWNGMRRSLLCWMNWSRHTPAGVSGRLWMQSITRASVGITCGFAEIFIAWDWINRVASGANSRIGPENHCSSLSSETRYGRRTLWVLRCIKARASAPSMWLMIIIGRRWPLKLALLYVRPASCGYWRNWRSSVGRRMSAGRQWSRIP